MKEQVFEIIAGIMDIKISMISINSSPQTIESWDSLHHMRLILALEESLGLNFNEEDIMSMVDVQTILSCIYSKK
jgi:acyl carrier protein